MAYSGIHILQLTLGLVVGSGETGVLLQVRSRTLPDSLFSWRHFKREVELATPTPDHVSSTTSSPSSLDVGSILSNYWYVLLVLLVGVVMALVFSCACIVRKKRRQDRRELSQMELQSPESVRLPMGSAGGGGAHQISSSELDLGSGGSPGSLSSPLPSPQPSFSSSHRSLRTSRRGSGRGKRWRNHSPGHTTSSGSEDTIRPFHGQSLSSLGSSASTIGPHGGKIHRTESFGSGRGSERAGHTHHMSHRRSRSNSQVKITALSEDSPLHSAPSTLSIASSQSRHSSSRHSHHSSHLHAPMPRQPGHIKVDVKVHLEQNKPPPSQIAAALAESARQLAQSAANFEQEDQWAGNQQWPRSNLSSPRPAGHTHSVHYNSISRRQLFPNHSSSLLMMREDHPHIMPIANINRHGNTASLDHGNIANLDQLRITANKPRNAASLDRPVRLENMVSLDRPGHVVSLDRPGHVVSLDRPGHAVSLDRPGHAVSLDRPGHAASLDRPGHVHAASLNQPTNHRNAVSPDRHGNGVFKRRNSTSSYKSFNSDSPHFFSSNSSGAKPLHNHYHHIVQPNTLEPRSSESGTHEEGLAPPPPPPSPRHLPLQPSDTGGVGVESNASNLSRAAGATSTLEASQELNTASSPPSSPSSSRPSQSATLSRSGSPLSSTASGYAATGSTSSLETVSKHPPMTPCPGVGVQPLHHHSHLNAQPLLSYSLEKLLTHDQPLYGTAHDTPLSCQMTDVAPPSYGRYRDSRLEGAPPSSWVPAPQGMEYGFSSLPHHMGLRDYVQQGSGLPLTRPSLTDCSSESIVVDV